ncbi:MAG: hypothetical protein WCF57_09970 [Pyrinomonadaceae bacterium]
MKRLLEISIYRPGDFAFEAADVDARDSKIHDVFFDHAMVRSRFGDDDFRDLYRIIRAHEKPQRHGPMKASQAAHPGDRMKQAVGSYLADNSEMVRSSEDGLGLPESPIYSNFSKHLWTTHARHGSTQSPNRSRENTDGPRTPQGSPLPKE